MCLKINVNCILSRVCRKYAAVVILLIQSVMVCAGNSDEAGRCDSILALPVNAQQIDLLLEQTIYKKHLKNYARRALELSEEIHYSVGIMHSLDQLGVMERNDSHYAEAMLHHKRCLALAESQQSAHWILRSCINLGVVYRRIDEYEMSLRYFLRALPLAEEQKNEREIASCLGNIGTLYLSLDKLDDAMTYFRKSLSKSTEQNNYQGLSISYGSIGRVYEQKGMLDSAQYCYERNLYYSTEWKDNNGISISYSSMGNVAKKRGDLTTALEYCLKALDISIDVGDRIYISSNYANLGEVYLLLGDRQNAEKNYVQSLQTAQDAGIKRSMEKALGGLSGIYELQNRNVEALHALRRQMALKDSILNEENMRRIEILKVAYELQQKEQTISALKIEKRLILGSGITGIIVLLLALTIFSFLWRLTVQKKRIAENQIKQLEQEKQLIATQAVLDGEVQERIRLARDLHDGLGGLLSAVKLHLNELKKDIILNPEDTARFDKTIGMLDESMNEMRRVAHHLMPDALSRFGLKMALTDFCNSIPVAAFTYFGDGRRIDRKLEEVVYRIAHELVNNALKHSGASHILVQIVQESDRLALTVEDNGKGFDPEATTTGMGLANIRIRVASFGGTMDMRSSAESGTEANVEFRVEN